MPCDNNCHYSIVICNITQMHIWSLTVELAISLDICYLSHGGNKNLSLIVSEFLCRLLAPVLLHIFAISIIQITCDYLKNVWLGFAWDQIHHSPPRSLATLSWYHLPEHARLCRFLKLEKHGITGVNWGPLVTTIFIIEKHHCLFVIGSFV